MPGWRLRSARTADLGTLAALERQIFPTDAWSARMIARELAAPHTHYLVAVEPAGEAGGPDVPGGAGERIAGYAGVFAARGSGDADIQTVAVRAEARGRGIGRALVTELVCEAARRGARRVFLEVRADNTTAQHLYESLGFARIAVRPCYYQPDDVDAWVMRRLVQAVPGPAGADGPAAGPHAEEKTS